eukprot:jgi/Galph1/5097/GphlegSOOS_G3713.1
MARVSAEQGEINRASENLYNSSDDEQLGLENNFVWRCLVCGCQNELERNSLRHARGRGASLIDLRSWAEPRSSRSGFSLEDALAPVVKAYKNFLDRVGGDTTLIPSSFDTESEDSEPEHNTEGTGDEFATARNRTSRSNESKSLAKNRISPIEEPTSFGPRGSSGTSGSDTSPRQRNRGKTGRESTRLKGNIDVERQLSDVDPHTALKYRLKALFRRVAHPKDTYLNQSGSAGGQVVDGEFLLLAKVYVVQCEEEELELFSKNDPASLKHLLPFLLNSLLYGTYEIQKGWQQQDLGRRTTGLTLSKEKQNSGNSRMTGFDSFHHLKHEMRYLQETRLLKLISNYNVTESQRGVFRLHGKVRRQRLKEAQERAAARKAQIENSSELQTSPVSSRCIVGERGFMDSLEPFILKQCMQSLEFALHCFWYFQSSLVTGPPELHSRTLRLLLAVEAAVVCHQVPSNIFLESGNRNGSLPTGLDVYSFGSRSEWNSTLEIAGSLQSKTADEKGNEASTGRELYTARTERSNMFHAEIDFVKGLTDISDQLRQVPRDKRQHALQRELEKLNTFLPRNVGNRLHRILRVAPECSIVLSTKERCPFLLVYEIEDLSSELAFSPRKTQHEENSANNVSIPEESASVTRQREREDSDDEDVFSPRKFNLSKHLGRESSSRVRKTERFAMKKEAAALATGGAFENEPNRPDESFKFQPNVGTSNTSVKDQRTRVLVEKSERLEKLPNTLESSQERNAASSGNVDSTSMIEVDLGAPLEEDSSDSLTNKRKVDKLRRTASATESFVNLREDAPDPDVEAAFGEPFAEKERSLREKSPFGYLRRWKLGSCIVKAHDQLRQEMFATRLIAEFARIYAAAGLPLWLRPYNIIATSADSGIIETVRDASSLDSIKRNTPNFTTLADFFRRKFGERGSPKQKMALRNFVESMAGYSVVQYLLQIKDRHNGNILIDSEGHIIHIDFGFLLSNSPGGNFEFEKSPFKLSSELVQVMGGIHSSAFRQFRKLCVQGYVECCHHRDKIVLMVDMLFSGNDICLVLFLDVMP